MRTVSKNGEKKLCCYTTYKMSVMNFHLQLSWVLDIVSIASVRVNQSKLPSGAEFSASMQGTLLKCVYFKLNLEVCISLNI